MSYRLALYPGTFDPPTFGHLDILERAATLFDEVEVTVAVNAGKRPLLHVDERCELLRKMAEQLENVRVGSFEGLLVDYARERGAVAVVRGLRQVSDFDFEFRMAFANRKLCPEVETVLLMTSEAHAFTSSSIVREIFSWGGDVRHFVPEIVAEALEARRS